MYEETGCFDPNSIAQVTDDSLCQALQPPQQPLMAGSSTNSHNSYEDNNNLMLSTNQELTYHHLNNPHNHEDHMEIRIPLQNQQIGCFNTHNLVHQDSSSNQVLTFNQSSLQDATFTSPPDLLNLFHLPRCSVSSSLLPSSSISFTTPNQTTTPLGFVSDQPMADTTSASSILYDPLSHLTLPPHEPPLFRDLFQSLPPHNLRCGSLVGGGGDDHVDGGGGGGIYHDGGDGDQQFDNGVLDFTWDMSCAGKGRESGKMAKHYPTDRQRRQHINDKYTALRNLVPNPTKNDRASIVGDAIEYIKELLRTVNELKILVEKKRLTRERSKRQKTTDRDESTGNGHEGSSATKAHGDTAGHSFNNGSLRSSWLQRKSKDTEVDVRIVDDEVTIKLVQRKKINCLLFVSKVLDELQLDLHHVAGGHIGDYYSFLFNTKIYEGSSVYASAIANKLIEVVEKHYNYASTPSTSCF